MSTLTALTVKCLKAGCVQFDVPQQPLGQGRLNQNLYKMINAWFAVLCYIGSQSALLPSIFPQEAVLAGFVKLSGDETVQDSANAASNLYEELQSCSASLRPVIALVQSLANFATAASPEYNNAGHLAPVAAGQQQSDAQQPIGYLPEHAALHAILLNLKLLSLLSKPEQQEDIQLDPVHAALLSTLQTLVGLPTTLETSSDTQQPTLLTSVTHTGLELSKLAAAAMQMLVPLMWTNLKQGQHTLLVCCCSTVSYILSSPAAAACEAKDAFVQSGGVTLLLALVEKQTRGASQCPAIITTLLNIHAASTHDATLSALLLQFQTVPRLSALLQPSLCTNDRNDVIKPVKAAFETAKWQVVVEQKSQLANSTKGPAQLSDLCHTAACMVQILKHDPLHQPVQNTASQAAGTDCNHDSASGPSGTAISSTPVWPVWLTPSAKAWQAVQTTAIRAVATLRWAHNKVEQAFKSEDAAAVSQLDALHELLEKLLQLLAILLTGHLRNSHLDKTKVYEANIVENVVYSFSVSAEHGRHDRALADFTIAMLEGATVHLKVPTPAGTNAAWIKSAVRGLLSCFCSDTGPECWPAASAMSFFEEGLAHNSVLKEYCLRYSSVAAVHFHDAVVQSKEEAYHLTAVANMAVLCKLEADAAGNVDRTFRNDTFFSKAYLDRTFDCILDSLQRAVQEMLLWSESHVNSLGSSLRALSKVPKLLLRRLPEDVPGLQQVGVDLINKLPKLTESLTLQASSTLLGSFLTLFVTLPGRDMDQLGRDTGRALTHHFVTSLRQSMEHESLLTPATQEEGMCTVIIDWLFKATKPAAIDCLYFGQEAYPLAQQLLLAYAEQRKLAFPDATDCTHIEMRHVSTGHLIMLASYTKMYPKDEVGSQISPPAAAVCACMTHLFLLLERLVARHKELRPLQLPLLHTATNSRSKQKAAMDEATQEFKAVKVQIDSSLKGFRAVAAEASLVDALKQKGPQAWCLNDNSPGRLHQDLTYLMSHRVLPISSITQIQRCFALTTVQTGKWLAAGEQLIAEEQQAADKAAAKKAKKLRQKANKQQEQKHAAKASTACRTDIDVSENEAQGIPATLAVTPAQTQAHLPAHTSAAETHELCQAFTSLNNAQSIPHDHGSQLASAHSSGDTPAVEAKQAGGVSGTPSEASKSDNEWLQDLFSCPITKAIMTDCVIAADGLSYERKAIASWLQHSSTSPATGQPLQHKRLVPNIKLKQLTAVTPHL